MDKDWEKDYVEHGIKAQRLYPNEALLRFMGGEGLLSGKKAKILEVGCGSGANLWMMAKEGHDVHGIDISAESLKIADCHLNEKWGVSATLSKGSFTEIEYENESFDYVVDVVSLQHLDLERSQKALKEVNRVLKRGGVFFSYRLSDGSTPFFFGNPLDKKIDEVTLENISNNKLPLSGNGTVSFWNPSVAHVMYDKARLNIKSIEKDIRTYNNGLYRIEYMSINASKE